MLLALAGAALLAGCASSPLSPEQRSAFQRVSIAKVEMPDKPTIFGEHAAATFLLTGPIGLAIAQGVSDLPTEFRKSLDKSHTDVSAILRADLERKLALKGFQVLPEGDPRAQVVLVPKVLQYGLTGDVFATPPVRVPAFWVRLDLQKPGTTQTLWWHFASVHANQAIFKQLDARPIADYFTDPVLLDRQFRKASDLVVDDVLSKM
jgi:hypothetical protein